MVNSVINPYLIKFSVGITACRLPSPDREILENLVENYIQTLIEDLNLPAIFSLSMRFSDAKDEAELASVRVSINRKKCRTPITATPVETTNCQVLASTIMGIIHKNRGHIVNRPMSRLISKTYITDANTSLTNLSSTELHKLIVTMVKRGFGIHRWTNFAPNSETKGWKHLHYYDTIIEVGESACVRVNYNKAYHQLNAQTVNETLREMFSLMQDGLFYELGIAFPKIEWQVDERLSENEFQIQLNDVNYPTAFGLKPKEILVNDTPFGLLKLNIEGKSANNPANGLECTIVDEVFASDCEKAGLTTWDPLGYLILYLSRQLRQQAGSFLIKDVVANNLNSLGTALPDLVNAILSQYDLFSLTWTLRELLDEELSIRDLRSILDSLLLINGVTQIDLSQYIILYPEGTHLIPSNQEHASNLSFTDYANHIRATALKRYISHKYTKGQGTLIVYLLAPEIEDRVRDLYFRKKKLSKAERQEIIDAVYKEVGHQSPTTQNVVILTTTDVRRPFRKLIEVEFSDLAVLCYQELSPDLNIQPIARIGT